MTGSTRRRMKGKTGDKLKMPKGRNSETQHMLIVQYTLERRKTTTAENILYDKIWNGRFI